MTGQVAEGYGDGLTCPEISLGNLDRCPALSEKHGIILPGPRHCRPAAGCQAPVRSGMVYCLPLVGEEMRAGIVRLRYEEDVPSPRTRYLAGLLDIAGQAAQAIARIGKNARDRVSADFPVRVLRAPERETAQPFLAIRCLGSFELRRQGRLIIPDMVKRRGTFTLLKILLLNMGRSMPRDVLAEILWPESAPGAAANRLHVLVHSLRTIVEPFPDRRQRVYVRNDGDRYYFNVDSPHRLDIQEFRELVCLGDELESRGDRVRAVAAYEKAVQLYRGGLLEDEPYAEWCWAEREEILETCLAVLGKLAFFSAREGAAESSIAWYRRALRLDPLREHNHQGLIRTLLASGRRDEALRQYRACRDILRKELDVAPLPETEELYNIALRG
ncbi:MAG: winged helix-turn-helix domain-containing protein [Armatimonadetes bacterium]|nr:winged helix-turn-helix domain-containing protein [Armatimonadota bacterium]